MAKWQKVKIDIPKAYEPKERRVIGEEIIDYIIERTLKGKDKDNNKFKSYSKSYIKSLDFKLGGKRRSPVNLKLSGDMLASIKVLSHKKGEVTVGFDKSDTENNGKAEGNILGTYGQKTSTGKKRDFLGISDTDLRKQVLKNYPEKDKTKRQEAVKEYLVAQEISEDIVDNISTSDMERILNEL